MFTRGTPAPQHIMIFRSTRSYNVIRRVGRNASNNPKITDVSHMTNLKILHAGRNCEIDDYKIRNLNLTNA